MLFRSDACRFVCAKGAHKSAVAAIVFEERVFDDVFRGLFREIGPSTGAVTKTEGLVGACVCYVIKNSLGGANVYEICAVVAIVEVYYADILIKHLALEGTCLGRCKGVERVSVISLMYHVFEADVVFSATVAQVVEASTFDREAVNFDLFHLGVANLIYAEPKASVKNRFVFLADRIDLWSFSGVDRICFGRNTRILTEQGQGTAESKAVDRVSTLRK